MAFTISHTVLATRIAPVAVTAGGMTHFTVNLSGTFDVLYPGTVHPGAAATVVYKTTVAAEDTGPARPGTTPLHGGNTTTTDTIHLTVVIHDPAGQVFTATEVTAADLQKFRNLRGEPGTWRYTVTGTSKVYDMDPSIDARVLAPPGSLSVVVVETVPSTSAAPLVASAALDQPLNVFQFDLYRVGTFVASVSGAGFGGTMQLLDPDGVVVGSSHGGLRCAITQRMLAKSRTAAGAARQWVLKVEGVPHLSITHPTITATVLAEGRIATATLIDRLQWFLGPHGSNVQIAGANTSGLINVMLTVDNLATAETLDMLGLLDSHATENGAPTPIPLYAGVDTIEKYGQTFSLDVSSLKITSIDVDFGPSTNLPGAAVFKLAVSTSGGVAIKWKGLHLATGALLNNHIDVEFGIQVDAGGIPRFVTWAPKTSIDISYTGITLAAVVAAILATPLIGLVGAEELKMYIDDYVNGLVTDGAAQMFTNPNLAPTDFMMLFGGHFTYHPPRFEGTDVLFEHVAPLEPNPRPRLDYHSALGARGDTWAAPNLKSKIDHIVVVMMENRSYDHVLGYRAPTDGTDGLTADVVAAMHEPVRPMSQAAFHANNLGLRTGIPVPVGHALADVKEQLAGQIPGPGSRILNDPAGFVSNFKSKLAARNADMNDGTVATDVLGYYEASDLPMYAFLAKNYAYSDHYYASHPGPTMPNRMYSLTGDAQHDRYGTPVLDNNSGDNFVLSRATTIYDVLAREGVSFRVYESFPSVTMLRMFARYATDNVNIRPFDKVNGFDGFDADMQADPQHVPSVIVVEPAMHHAPENDDHPISDVYRGQSFIREVYQSLAKNKALWERTLLVITYDEHGGFYDHVVPPLAEMLKPASVVLPGGATRHPIATTVENVVTAPAGLHANLSSVATAPAGLHANLSNVEVHAIEGRDPSVSIPFGVRVPTFVVSPQVPADAKPGVTLDHCSILKTILARFCGDARPFLSDRVAAANSFEAFVTAPTPHTDVDPIPGFPDLGVDDTHRAIPGMSKIVTPILTRARMRTEQVDYHDLSGRLARLLGR
jgi:phospholipase C